MDPFAYFNIFLNKNGIDNKACGMFVLSAATYIYAWWIQRTILSNMSGKNHNCWTYPPQKHRVRASRLPSSSTQRCGKLQWKHSLWMCLAAFSLLAKFCQNVNFKIRKMNCLWRVSILTIKNFPDFFFC